MKNYEKPMVMLNQDIAEGVYAASGVAGINSEDCYTVTTNIHQTPQDGRGDYRVQVDAVHSASHHGGKQRLEISFNQPVEYNTSGGTLMEGNGTTTLKILYSYHSEYDDNVGLGDVVVKAETNPALAVTGAVLYCNKDCGQH